MKISDFEFIYFNMKYIIMILEYIIVFLVNVKKKINLKIIFHPKIKWIVP